MKTSGTIENIEMNRFRESKKQNEIRTEDQMALHEKKKVDKFYNRQVVDIVESYLMCIWALIVLSVLFTYLCKAHIILLVFILTLLPNYAPNDLSNTLHIIFRNFGHPIFCENEYKMGSYGCGSVGRAVDSNTRDPQFKCSLGKFYSLSIV